MFSIEVQFYLHNRRIRVVRVGGVDRIGDKSRLSATENFKTVLSSLEMRSGQSFVLSRLSLKLFAT